MSVKRNKRQRKKLHLGEFTEIGFTVSFTFPTTTEESSIDEIVDAFISEAVVAQGLVFDGCGYYKWQGLIGPKQVGKCTVEQQANVQQWLADKGLTDITVSELFDVWWD